MNLPAMHRIRQIREAPRIDDIENALAAELAGVSPHLRIRTGDRIAVTAGSRGIAAIDRILGGVLRFLRERGAEPFLFPAMGSHGGGTAEGQLAVLESLGITEATMGTPIFASMEVVEIGRSSHGFPVYVDKIAAGADGIVAINRIKPHTDFNGPIESGLMKMLAVGMGKHKGCIEIHKQTLNFGYSSVIPEYGEIVLAAMPVRLGVGIVENSYEQVAEIRAVLPENFRGAEERLLVTAKSLMARLPYDRIDLLIVDQMGKNISGTGMDTNVIGRIMFIGEPEPETPRISRIIVTDLTDAAHGNACGIGLADYTVRRLVDKIDLRATAINTMAGGSPEKGRIPVTFETDREAVLGALETIGAVSPEQARIVHIRNTLELSEMEISEALLAETERNETLRVVRSLGPLSFDRNDAIHPLPSPPATGKPRIDGKGTCPISIN